ncbi:srp14p [Saccharomyces arboricola H-6]|uniref:Signal recognition particle subunit SRP14 n=1 Tax=Saccharomyces arboricola (strain H-6 / AS 2.3317 / CBS 10644) TaxID=1160507 RepID=J8LQG9_SACAR|nr:srp14p [Saccharomyces arboricola H-6]
MTNTSCLSPNDFLSRVPEFFKIANEKHITVRLTAKRLIEHDPVDGNLEFDAVNHPAYDVSRKSSEVLVSSSSDKEYQLLIRMSYGSHDKKAKCSTVVKANELDQFWQDYSSVFKGGMQNLIKKKKKKSKGGPNGKNAKKNKVVKRN